MKKPTAIAWFEIFVSDFDKSKKFYEEILGTSLTLSETEHYKMAMFDIDCTKGGVSGSITKMEGHNPGPGGTLVYLNVEGELDAVLARIPAAGGKVIRDRFEIPPHGFIALFSDPEGNIVGLHSMV